MTSFIQLTDVNTRQTHHVAVDKIIQIVGAEAAAVHLADGTTLTVAESPRKIETMIRSRTAKDQVLLQRAVEERAGLLE